MDGLFSGKSRRLGFNDIHTSFEAVVASDSTKRTLTGNMRLDKFANLFIRRSGLDGPERHRRRPLPGRRRVEPLVVRLQVGTERGYVCGTLGDFFSHNL